MRSNVAILLALAVAGCQTPGSQPAMRGVASVHEPVLTRSSVAFDAGAQGGYLSPEELARLDGWFRSMDLGYGDTIYVDGGYPDQTRAQVAQLAGRYGMMLSAAAPVTAGAVPAGFMRVIVSRASAHVPGCPNWNVHSQPNYNNLSMSNFGCGVNANLAMQAANPEDLFRGRSGPAASDGVAGAKAVQMYRDWPLTAIEPGQKLRPLPSSGTRTETSQREE
ncbi:MAG TPA: CpaD family pilus assembly protein [Sphingomicrobium sp.]|nr:CpaD family pilus assembly protein [Sphingomicrobium sp.]